MVVETKPHPIQPERSPKSNADWLPFAWCNLWRNPFGELTRSERAEVAVINAEEIVGDRFGRLQAIQLIGDCGRGKTTRMLVLQKWFSEASYVYLPEDKPCPAIPDGWPLLIDEAQRLPRRVRKQIFATGLPLILATHRNLHRPLRRAGYEVSTFKIGSTNNAELIQAAMNRRIEASRLNSNEPVPVLPLQDAMKLHGRFGDDMRSIEGYLYDKVQTQVFSNGKMRFVD